MCSISHYHAEWDCGSLLLNFFTLMMTSSNGNIFRVTGHLCVEFTGQWHGALVFSLICVWINGWISKREAGDLRRHRAHYDVIVIYTRILNHWMIMPYTPAFLVYTLSRISVLRMENTRSHRTSPSAAHDKFQMRPLITLAEKHLINTFVDAVGINVSSVDWWRVVQRVLIKAFVEHYIFDDSWVTHYAPCRWFGACSTSLGVDRQWTYGGLGLLLLTWIKWHPL